MQYIDKKSVPWYNYSDCKYMGWVPIQLHLKLNSAVNMRGAYVMLLLLKR